MAPLSSVRARLITADDDAPAEAAGVPAPTASAWDRLPAESAMAAFSRCTAVQRA